MNKSKIAFFFVLMFSVVMSLAEAGSASQCNGRMVNPITDLNWNNAYPITIMGFRVGAGANPPLMNEPPICFCPGRLFGMTQPGVGITFWEPLYVAEVQRKPGCYGSLGGKTLLGGYEMQEAEQQRNDLDDGNSTNMTRMQVHWFVYPVFELLELFKESSCMASSGFALAYSTELDPTHQNDLWGAIYSPEGELFGTPVAQMACSVDAVASTVAFPIDALFWCLGTAGSLYPMTGNSQDLNSNQTSNMALLGKFIAKMHRMTMLYATIGPQSICFAWPSPFIIKSQYRINPIYPVRSAGRPIYLGQSEFRWGLWPPSNYATRESTSYMIWQGQQCCAR